MKKFTILLMGLLTLTMVGLTQQKPTYGLYTDRDVYVSGETLMAKIYLPDGTPSSILCLDLVNQHGTWITGASLSIHDNEAEGYLQLPDSLSSGTYFVRTYQKYNAGKLKTNREIWISSRFDGLEKTQQIKRVVPHTAGLQDKKNSQIEIQHLDASYPINSKIEARFTIDESLLKELDGNLLVSVAQTDPSFDPATFSVLEEHQK